MNKQISTFTLLIIGMAALAMPSTDGVALTVTQPTATTVVAAGDEYASEQLSNPWDMNDTADIDTDDSVNVTSQTFFDGIFSAATTAGSDNQIFPLFGGFVDSINSSRGYLHPVDTARYRYFTIKMRATRPTANTEVAYLGYFAANYTTGACGQTGFAALPSSTWTIITFDLVANNAPNSNCGHQWQDFPVGTLRFNPALDNNSPFKSVSFDIDWIRLTAPAANGDKTSVQWTDSGFGGTYTVTLNETGNNAVSVLLKSGISGTSYQADLTPFPAGQYTLTVSRDGDPATSDVSGAFRINATPMIAVNAPDFHGDQTKNFATTVVGNAWGPINATDFAVNPTATNWKNVSYTTPTGSFYGRPTNGDPQWYMNLGNHAIDTSLYRSLCFTLKDFGQRSVGLGSVARFFWGQKTDGKLTISQDIPLSSGGPNEYCVPDIAAAPIEPTSLAGPWTGTQTLFRLDPHEFPVSSACTNTPTAANCHDVELDSVVLSPFAQADPGFAFKWNLSDSDDANVNLNLYLDPDTTFGNGNEVLIYSAIVPTSVHEYDWPGSGSVNYGTYHAYLVADDGKNSVGQYSTGPIIIGKQDGIFRDGFESTR